MFPLEFLHCLISEIASIEGIGNPEGGQIFETKNRQKCSELNLDSIQGHRGSEKRSGGDLYAMQSGENDKIVIQ
ncbi:MAG TPA: hypothetical protein ACFCUC_16070 [Desulfobacterales bacterium]